MGACPILRNWRSWSVALCVASNLRAPPAVAGEARRVIDASRVLDAGVPNSGPSPAIGPAPADPPPLVERGRWVFDLRWDRGAVWLLGATRLDLAAPQPTPRAMGRFALELYEGLALIERVRFDFPLLAVPDAPSPGQVGVSPHWTPKLRTRIGVIFPATRRGTRLELSDRATGERWSLPWPPQEVTDAGAPSIDVTGLPPAANDGGRQ